MKCSVSTKIVEAGEDFDLPDFFMDIKIDYIGRKEIKDKDRCPVWVDVIRLTYIERKE